MMTPEELQRIIAKETLGKVASTIGYNKTAVCHVANGTYRASPARILQAAEDKYSCAPVDCPILGTITLSECVEAKHREHTTTNPLRAMLGRTCPKCGQGAAKREVR